MTTTQTRRCKPAAVRAVCTIDQADDGRFTVHSPSGNFWRNQQGAWREYKHADSKGRYGTYVSAAAAERALRKCRTMPPDARKP